MSRVTNIVLTIDDLPDVEERFLEHINSFMPEIHFMQLHHVKHFGGNKCAEIEVFTAAINYCDVEALCNHLNSFEGLGWSNCAAGMINTEGEGVQIWRYGFKLDPDWRE